MYIAPELNHDQRASYWRDLLRFIDEWVICHPKSKVIVTGDLNTRDRRLGLQHTENHAYLDEVLLTLEIISDPRIPTRENNTLDITLANTIAVESNVKSKVIHKLNSDHNPTAIQIDLNFNTCTRKHLGKPTHTVMDIKTTMKRILQALQYNNQDTVLLEDINIILRDAITYKTIRHRPIKFWTPDLKKAVRLQNRARKAIGKARKKKENTEIAYRKYKNAQKAFKNLFRIAKKEYNNKRIEIACSDPTGAEFYKVIKQLEPALNKKHKLFTEHSVDAVQETEQIANKFETIFKQNDVQPTVKEQQRMEHDIGAIKAKMRQEQAPLFTMRELQQAVRRANVKSAKGPDGVSNRLIVLACEEPEFRQMLLSAINNQIICKGEYPESLKTARIIPLPKAKAGEYRPISLLPSLSKLVEYILQIRIRELVELKLPKHQFGCRPGLSTSHALMRLMHYSGVAAGNNEQFGAILYDFTKAYDRVPRHRLLKKMKWLNIPAYLTNIVYEWLSNRKFTVAYRETETAVRTQENGIPQGSSLSVLLWIIFVYDIPLSSSLTNIYVDDTIGWATGPTKHEVKFKLTEQLAEMTTWCRKNKIQINTDKTHVIFNEYHPKDCIVSGTAKIQTTESIRYLGAEIIANKASNHSTFLIRTDGIAKDIIKRCKIIKRIRKYRISEKVFRQACHAFIGGIFNFYTPWLGGELAIKATMRPVELAYHEYMRTYTGCMRSTPIPVLYAISRFPLLRDRIVTESTLVVLKAAAQGTLLGKDYRKWDKAGCQVDGWTPFGQIREAIEKKAKQFQSKIHSQQIIQSGTLEGLTKCKFNLGNRKIALEKHRKGLLIPDHPDIAIWTDGSLQRDPLDGSIETGSAAIVHISDPDPHSTIFELHIENSLKLQNVYSSYETEIIALQLGLETLLSMNPSERHIHIFTDSLSCLQQLHTLPLKYKYTNSVVVDVAEKLENLVSNNQVELHFIPSHTEEIPESDEIDELAKNAAEVGDELIDHDPLISTYKRTFQKIERVNLKKYLYKNVKKSGFKNYPDRAPLRDGEITIKKRSGNTTIRIDSNHALLNRVRTGHTRARAHIKNINIESENTCRHCHRHKETIEHQLIKCKIFKKQLKKSRRKYTNMKIDNFNEALYTHSKFMANFITEAQKHGCYI